MLLASLCRPAETIRGASLEEGATRGLCSHAHPQVQEADGKAEPVLPRLPGGHVSVRPEHGEGATRLLLDLWRREQHQAHARQETATVECS